VQRDCLSAESEILGRCRFAGGVLHVGADLRRIWGMATIRRKAFVGPVVVWGFKPVNVYRDRIRDAAESFVNDEIGVERVVSIVEHGAHGGAFTVCVWYRAEDDAPASGSRMFSNAELRDQPRGFDVTPAKRVAE
jgi:hypothetical protein